MTVRFFRCAIGWRNAEGRAGAPMPPDAELIAADAEGGLAIEIRIARQAKLDPRLDPGGGSRIVVAKVGNLELAEATVILAFATPVAFATPEVRQHLAIAPALCAETLPIVEVLMLAADEKSGR